MESLHIDTWTCYLGWSWSISFSFPPWIKCLYTFTISLDSQMAVSSVLSAEHWPKQKRRRARPVLIWIRGSRWWLCCSWRSIPILLTHPKAGCQLETMWWGTESKSQIGQARMPPLSPGQTYSLFLHPFSSALSFSYNYLSAPFFNSASSQYHLLLVHLSPQYADTISH